jgi:hypothetical protein
MNTQEIQLSNGERFDITNSDIPTIQKLVGSAIGKFEASQNVKTLGWLPISGSDRTCTVGAACVNPTGHITLTCPGTAITAGTSFTISVTATNDASLTGLYIIGITLSPACTVTSFPSGGSATQSPALTIAAGATSASQSWAFTMKSPAVPISVVCNLSSDCPT